jgi:hypothetical protein
VSPRVMMGRCVTLLRSPSADLPSDFPRHIRDEDRPLRS